MHKRLEKGRLTHEKIRRAELVSVTKPVFGRSPAPTSEQQLARPPRANRPIVAHKKVFQDDTCAPKNDNGQMVTGRDKRSG